MNILLESKKSIKHLPPSHRVFKIEAFSEEDRQANVDWDFIKEVRYNKQAYNRAKEQAIKLSATSEIYSVHLIVPTEDDPFIQEFYEGGVMTSKLF